MARRTKEDAEKTREALLDAAERVFLRHGFASATLNEIAKEAGVTRGAVYWHFEDKISIFRAMYERVKLPIDALYETLTTGPDPLNGLKSLCIQVLESVARDEHTRNVFTIVRLRNGGGCDDESVQEMSQKRAHTIARFEKVFTEAKDMLAAHVTPHDAALGLHAFFSGILWDYLSEPASYPLEQSGPRQIETYFRGILR
jgi:AcrR family transcriptional regulator